MKLNWPLMQNNITPRDSRALIAFLKKEPILTQNRQVERFEHAWSRWLGVKYSVFVNSGSSANLITLAALREMHGTGEIIVPPLTWVSDIASTLWMGFKPVFVDIHPQTLGLNDEAVLKHLNSKTKAVFLTHILGLNALTARLLKTLRQKKILLIEDACESHGTTFQGKKVGTFGWASNFSFYYAHHLTTIEGGMVSTHHKKLYELLRLFRSHGMVRESSDATLRSSYQKRHSDLHPHFIFAYPGFNVRGTEIQAVLGLEQLRRLSRDNEIRRRNFQVFIQALDSHKYRTDFNAIGSCNYAFILVLKHPDRNLRRRVERLLDEQGVEYRRGTSGGGNQLRQPYLKKALGRTPLTTQFPEVEHIHFFGYYIGNYPSLKLDKIKRLCSLLNAL